MEELQELSDEVLLYIFRFLGVQDIVVVRLTCKRWAAITFESTLWRSMVLSMCDKQVHLYLFQSSIFCGAAPPTRDCCRTLSSPRSGPGKRCTATCRSCSIGGSTH